MICAPKIVETKQINNEQVAYRIVCCDEKCCNDGCREGDHLCCTPDAHGCEDSWHTISIHVEDHDAALEPIKVDIAIRHEKMRKWREKA